MATNYVTASYQEVIDLHTESDTTSVIGIHTPNSATPTKMLGGFWDQFRKFKYDGCSISLVPAARLPADPLQVSYTAGEATIDPRDMLNPILWHGCHGDDLGTILNQLYSGESGNGEVARHFSDSADQNIFDSDRVGNDFVEALYYKALTDKTWGKAHPQAGFRKSGLRPLVHRIVTNHGYGQFATLGSRLSPLAPDASTDPGRGEIGVNRTSTTNPDKFEITPSEGLMEFNVDTMQMVVAPTFTGTAFMTSRMEPLGWLDTHTNHITSTYYSDELSGDAASDAGAISNLLAQGDLNPRQTVPKLFMGMIMLPPAYKTEQYFRLIINHRFSFKSFRGVSMNNSNAELVNNAPSVFNFN